MADEVHELWEQSFPCHRNTSLRAWQICLTRCPRYRHNHVVGIRFPCTKGVSIKSIYCIGEFRVACNTLPVDQTTNGQRSTPSPPWHCPGVRVPNSGSRRRILGVISVEVTPAFVHPSFLLFLVQFCIFSTVGKQSRSDSCDPSAPLLV